MTKKLIAVIFITYLILATVLSGFYSTVPLLFVYARTVNWLTLSFSLILTLITAWLVAVNAVHIYERYKERKNCTKQASATAIAASGGLAAGICPLCVTGLFPIILGFFGISFSFAILPFNGIEVQLLVVALLLGTLHFSRKQKSLNR